MNKKTKHIIFSFIFLIIVLLVTFLFLEVTIRIFAKQLFSKVDSLLYAKSNNPDIIYQLKYNFKSVSGDIITQGFRGKKKYATEKPLGCYRIMAVGDSSTYGYGADKIEETYPFKLENILNSQKNKNNIVYEVINAGVPGYNTAQEFYYFKDRLINFKPNLVILGFMNNDLTDLNKNQVVGDLGTLINVGKSGLKIPFKNFLRQHSALYQYLGTNIELVKLKYKPENKSCIKAFPFSPTQDEWNKFTSLIISFKNICDKNNIKFLVILFPHSYQLSENYPIKTSKGFEFSYDRKYVAGKVFIQQKVKDICRENGINYLDLYPCLKANVDKMPYSPEDYVHPNGFGYYLVAKEISDYLYKNNH